MRYLLVGYLAIIQLLFAREGGNVVTLHEIASADLVSLTLTHRGATASVAKQSRRGGLVPAHYGHYCFDIVWHFRNLGYSISQKIERPTGRTGAKQSRR